MDAGSRFGAGGDHEVAVGILRYLREAGHLRRVRVCVRECESECECERVRE